MLRCSPLLPILTCAAALASAVPAFGAGPDAALVQAARSAAPTYRPGEVVVRYGGAHASRADPVPRTRVVRVAPGRSVTAAAAGVRKQRGVLSATPNYIAHLSGWVPPDPGATGTPGGWQSLQWNFLPDTGVNAPDAWAHMAGFGHPGGQGVTVAVLDTGVAYSDRDRFRRSPDLGKSRFVRG